MVRSFARNIIKSVALTLSFSSLTACGLESMDPLRQKTSNTRSAHGTDDGSPPSTSDSKNSGGLALTLPLADSRFAEVTHAQVQVSSAPSGLTKPCNIWTCGGAKEPSNPEFQPPTGSKDPAAAWATNQTVPYKPGEKVAFNDLPAGPVVIQIDLINKNAQSLYRGTGTARIQGRQTSLAVISVSPTTSTNGLGKLEIMIDVVDENAPNRPLPGGYNPISPSDPSVLKAADFALKKINAAKTAPSNNFKITGIRNSALQVVSGLNLAFVMTIQSGGLIETHEIIVYQALDGVMTVTKDRILSN